MIKLDQEREPESVAEWLLYRTAYVPGAAEALALQCVLEAAADEDQAGLAHWNLVLDAIETLRRQRSTTRQVLH